MPTEPRLALFLCALVVCGATRAASAEGARSAASPERFGSDLLEDEARGTTAMDDVMEVLLSRRARQKGDDHHHAEHRDRSPAKEEP